MSVIWWETLTPELISTAGWAFGIFYSHQRKQKWFRKGDQNHLNQDRWDLQGAFGQGSVPCTPWAALSTSSTANGHKDLTPWEQTSSNTTQHNKHQLSPSTLLRVLLVTQPVAHKRWELPGWSLWSRSVSAWPSTEKFKYFQQNSWLFLNAGLFSNGRQGKLNKEWNKRVYKCWENIVEKC